MALFKKRSAEDEFTREAVTLLRGMPAVTHIEPNGELSLKVQVRGRTAPEIVNLHNHFTDLRGLPFAERTPRLAFALSSITEERSHPSSIDEARASLLPSLRNPSYVAGFAAAISQPVPPDQMLATRAFGPHVVELVVLDRERSLSPVKVADLDSWAVGVDEVMAIARENLTAQDVTVRPAPDLPGAVQIVGPDAYQASLLTVPHVLVEIAQRTGVRGDDAAGSLLALAPTRDDLLLVTDADDARVGRALDWAVERYAESSRRLTPAPFVVSSDGVAPWNPPADAPVHEAVRTAQRHVANVEYGYQKAALDELFQASGEDVFVGSYKMGRRDDGSTFAYAAWVEGVTNGLMPEADVVGLVGEDQTSFIVTWADTLRIAGDSMALDTTLVPARWRVTGWPPAEVVEQLRAHATTL